MNPLSAKKCVNNNGTTWTHNQGVLLSGLALLYNATHNGTLLHIAQKIAEAAIEQLTSPGGILKEPCEPNCDDNQKLYKGIFARHLGYLLPYIRNAVRLNKYNSFLRHNAKSVWTTNRCLKDQLFGLSWNSTLSIACDSKNNVATSSAALDLFISAAKMNQSKVEVTTKWKLLGLGNCEDDNSASMPDFYSPSLPEQYCREIADQDEGAVAYDFKLDCFQYDQGYCRIRTLSGRQRTPPDFSYEDGSARNVTRTNKYKISQCYLKLK